MEQIATWCVIGLETEIPWPRREEAIQYCTRQFLLRPQTDTRDADISLKLEDTETHDDGVRLVRQLMSALAWAERLPIRETLQTGGGGRHHIGRQSRMDTPDRPHPFPTLAIPANDKSRLCIALYREALGLNAIPYKFLGFFKIINALHSDGSRQIAWINSILRQVRSNEAKRRLTELGPAVNIGDYLYESGRCAVAHAYKEPIANPDDPIHTHRLARDLQLMQAIAEHAIEFEFCVR